MAQDYHTFMHKRLAFLALITACGGSKDAGPGKDWSGKPLAVTIDSTVNNVGFTIKLPEGMKLDGEDKPDVITRLWRMDMKDHWSEPSVMVSYESIPAKDLAGFIEDQMIGGDTLATQEAGDDGFLIVHHTKDKGLVTVASMTRKGEHHLTCRASQAKDGGIPNPDKTIPWLTSICDSLEIE